MCNLSTRTPVTYQPSLYNTGVRVNPNQYSPMPVPLASYTEVSLNDEGWDEGKRGLTAS